MKLFKKKEVPVVHPNTFLAPDEPPKQGFDEFKSILSDWVVVRFAAPCHAWNEIAESKEWKDLVNLLEKYQKEYTQKMDSK